MKVKCIFHILLLSILIPLVVLSCGKKDEPEPEPIPWPYLKLEQVDYVVNAEAHTLSVPVKTNMSEIRVEISIGCDWIVYKDIVRTIDSDNAEFVFDIKTNDSDEERVGHVLFGSPFDNGQENLRRINPESIKVTQIPPSP